MTWYRRSLGKVKQAFKGRFICIKNDLMEIAPFPRGYFDHFLLAFIPKLNFSCITVNVRVGLSSEWEAATSKYVGINKFFF